MTDILLSRNISVFANSTDTPLPRILDDINGLNESNEQRHFGENQVLPGSIVTGVALFFIAALTITGNIMVFVAVIFNKKLRSVSNLFIMSLSMADLLLGTVVMIPATLNEIFGRWILASGFCVVWAGFDVMLCSASVLNVCLISLDRYIAVMSPLRYKVLVTHRRAFAMIAVAWAIAICASFIPLGTGIHNPDLPTLTNLTFLTETPQCLFIPSLTFVLIASTVTILLPIIVAFGLYYRVSKEAKRQACFVGVLIAPSNMLLGAKVANKHIREPFTRKATITLGIIVGAYVVTWAPFLITNILEALCTCVHAKLFSAFVWLGYCNSLINPIIYPFFIRDFRNVYLTALFNVCPCLTFLQKYKRDRVFFQNSMEFVKRSSGPTENNL
ncbi:5-hydroxytryptamine receptor 6-like [Mya arenaria]|uniref:5-hydroxytryptamine receptor 6-like n=1 Tax=Mya arenaria TaxID=6604 RepID=UPI0022E13B03|nr:5-hydroxytryptamine receptor 6-like [Mya arenaria]